MTGFVRQQQQLDDVSLTIEIRSVNSRYLDVSMHLPDELRSLEFDLKKIILEVLAKRDYHSLGEFHYKMMFIGNMHFMDPYNYDIERVKRCVIHYAMPDDRIVPFCAFWGLQQEYAIKMQLDYGESPKEWEARTGKKLKDDLYYRWKETAVPPSL